MARLREKSKDCEFGEQTNYRILEHLIQTVRDNDLIKTGIQKKWDLDQFIEETSQREDINQQVKDMKEDFKITKVGDQPKNYSRNNQQSGRRNPRNGNHCDYLENKSTRNKREALVRAVATVEKQDCTLQAETAQPTDNSA